MWLDSLGLYGEDREVFDRALKDLTPSEKFDEILQKLEERIQEGIKSFRGQPINQELVSRVQTYVEGLIVDADVGVILTGVSVAPTESGGLNVKIELEKL